MGALATSLLGAVTAEGVARLSKTKLSAHVGGLNAAVVLLPGVLWGRGNAD